MSWLKFSIVLCTGLLLVGLDSTVARSDDAPPRHDRGDNWDNGPVPGSPASTRRPQLPRGDKEGPLGPPETRDGVQGDPRQPPEDGNPRRPLRPRSDDRDHPRRPEGSEGPGENGPPPDGPDRDRPLPPGPPPRGREDFESLKTRDPEMYKAVQEDRDLERQAHDQADQYRHTAKEEQAKVKEKLVEIVNKHFEVRQQLRNLEVKRIEQQLKFLRDKIEQREKSRKDIVEKRVTELTGSDDEEHF